MTFNLAGKTALVTGSTRGIGKSIATALLESGASVCINGRNTSLINSFITEAKTHGHDVMAFKGDVTSEKDVRKMVKKIITEFGRLDILVNNVGGAGIRLTEDISVKEWSDVTDSNIKSTFLVSREVIPFMKEQKSGKIINISSTAGIMGKAGGAHYASAKYGIIGFTKSLARELGPFNITVNSVVPGFTDTDLTRGAYLKNDLYPKNMGEVIAKNTPLGRIALPEDHAHAVLFFASSMSDFVTGQFLTVDGGHSI
jgi:NAD(P)-dependent dehydrogenase (short-subunit alcohol dehydrogenase family)